MNIHFFFRRYLLWLILSLLTTISCKKEKTPAPLYGDIEGVIKETGTNTPIEGVAVSIVTTTRQSTDTDTKGVYSFIRLDPGDYTIQFTHPRYEAKSLKVTVTAGEKTPGSLSLEPKKSILEITPITLDFANSEGSKTIILKNGYGVGSVGFSAKSNDSWISISPSSGTLRNTESFPVAVTVDRKGLVPGSYTGSITFNADNNSFQYNVTLVIPNPNAPSVLTKAPANITQSSAEVGGEVTSLGGSNVTQRGHIWSENPNVNIDNAEGSTKLGPGALGKFNSSASGLKPGKRYYVRAYATNGNATGYGEAFPFETSTAQTPPAIIIVGTVTDITPTSAKLAGQITNDGGSAITEFGHVWSLNPKPTINEPTRTALGKGEVGKIFTSTLTNLKNGARYYVRAYAVSGAGVGYSNEEVSFEAKNPSTPPVLLSGAPTGVDQTYATFRANLTSKGSSDIIQSGFCWSTKHAEPTIEADSKIEIGPQNAEAPFSRVVTNLHKGTNYYYRPFVTTQDKTTFYGPTQVVVTLEDKLAFYYPFNGDAGDASPNGKSGSAEGAKLVSDRDGNPDRAYDLSKGNIRVLDANAGKWTGDVTIAFWAKISESNFTGQDKVLLSKSNSNDCYENAYTGFMLFAQPGVGSHLYFSTFSERNPKTAVAFEKGSIVNQWHHFALVKQSDKVHCYLDGFLVKSVDTYPTLSEYYGNYSMRWGDFSVTCQNRVAPFDALVDDFRLYSYALSESEVADVFRR